MIKHRLLSMEKIARTFLTGSLILCSLRTKLISVSRNSEVSTNGFLTGKHPH